MLVQAKLILPPSLATGHSLNIIEEYKTRSVAAARIHIERFNQRMKTFKFVTGVVPASKLEYLNMAVYTAAMLANFSSNLVQ